MRITPMRAIVAATAVTLVLGAGTVQSTSAQITKRAPVDVPSKKKPKSTTTTKAAKTSAVTDACKLLTLTEVTPLVPTATQGKPVAQSSGSVQQAMCRWEGESLDDSSDLVVNVITLPASAAIVKASLAGEAKDSGKQVSGVGDFAIVRSVIPVDAEVTAMVGKYLLTVDYSSSFTATTPARDRQDEVVAVAKLAAGRM